LGFSHPKYRSAVHLAGVAYAVIIAGGFSFLAIWAFFKGMQGGAV
jgi:hypothetical protein